MKIQGLSSLEHNFFFIACFCQKLADKYIHIQLLILHDLFITGQH